MSEGIGQEQVSAPGRGRRWMQFWIVQATEIAVAVVFAYLSVHVAHGAVLVISAVPLLALAVTAQGPLGLFRICGQRLHLWLAMALSAAIALAPIIPALRPDVQGIIVIEFGAVGLFRVATLTRTGDTRRAVSPAGRGSGPVIDAAATATAVGPGPSFDDPAAGGPGAGGSAPGSSGSGPSSSGPSSSDAVARWAGRASSAAVASGKRVAADYRPGAEDQVKRTIRGMGKWAARATARVAPPRDTGS